MLFREFQEEILPNSTHIAHPRYLAYVLPAFTILTGLGLAEGVKLMSMLTRRTIASMGVLSSGRRAATVWQLHRRPVREVVSCGSAVERPQRRPIPS